jgi:tetratricopeptide (TPR) repeat protein
MARDGLFALLCAALMSTLAPMTSIAAAAGDDRDGAIATTLEVQTALQQAREHLLHGDSRDAVYVLESHLARINGNRAYLDLLAQAYSGYIKELRLANQEEQAQKYLKRLCILDPGAALADTPAHNAGPAQPAPVSQPVAPPAKSNPKIRLKGPDEQSTDTHRDNKAAARELVFRAEREFGDRHYPEAERLFDRAHQADSASTEASRERWAYCKLHAVVDQLNQPLPGDPAWNHLEQEVRQALELAPRLNYGKELLSEIDKRRHGSTEAAPAAVSVRHGDCNSAGWYVAETANFRIYHRQSRELAEQVAQVAEKTRTEMQRKWFGETTAEWSPKCDIFLHATAQEYSQETGVPADSPGHSTFRTEGGRVVGRRIDLHVDNRNMLAYVLPHEATHVVLAGQFGGQNVPRWADEGMAVLSEPRDKVEAHLRNLTRCRQDRQLFQIRELMQMNDYPDRRLISAFYAQSVSLVEFLSSRHGPQVFARFLRDGLRDGYETALQRHFGYRDFDELQQCWERYASAEAGCPTGVARGTMDNE